jgi:putative sporulation protein YtaF
MHILSSFVFALSANIDNFTVGIAYGIKKFQIDLKSNVLIAAITGIGTFVSMTIGYIISKFLSAKVSNILGAAILIGIGIWLIIDYFLKKGNCRNIDKSKINCIEILDNPEKADEDNSGFIDIKESITLAFALTINNFGLGIGASISGLNIFLTTFLTFIFSILTIILGYFLGKSYFSKLLGKYASLFSGIIIVLLGLYEIFV